jgi:hypothetical protein
MQDTEFRQLLFYATEHAKQFALTYIQNELPMENAYRIQLNLSHDDPYLAKFDIYPEDNGKVIQFADPAMVIQTLLRNGKIPVWIDISVSESRKGKTVLDLLCAGRYTDEMKEMYYHDQQMGPFGVKSPNFPVDYEEGKKFKLPVRKIWSLKNLFRRTHH